MAAPHDGYIFGGLRVRRHCRPTKFQSVCGLLRLRSALLSCLYRASITGVTVGVQVSTQAPHERCNGEAGSHLWCSVIAIVLLQRTDPRSFLRCECPLYGRRGHRSHLASLAALLLRTRLTETSRRDPRKYERLNYCLTTLLYAALVHSH